MFYIFLKKMLNELSLKYGVLKYQILLTSFCWGKHWKWKDHSIGLLQELSKCGGKRSSGSQFLLNEKVRILHVE